MHHADNKFYKGGPEICFALFCCEQVVGALALPGVYAARSTQKWSSLLHKTQPQSHISQLKIR
jgi:hypothetical protein